MKLYSNTILSWPITLHLYHAGRVYPGKWNNHFLYRVNSRNPLILKTYSPLELLQENRQFYCYNRFYRDQRFEKIGNSIETIKIANQVNDFGKDIWIYIPKTLDINDIIVIKSNTYINELSHFNQPVLV